MKNQPLDHHPSCLHYHDLEPDQFRLIRVLPGRGDDIVTFDICLMRLSDLQPSDRAFIPVSYRWNHDQPLVAAMAYGHQIMIPKDIDFIMRMLRVEQGDYYRVLWIDQFSINQDDDNDKAHQIPLMKRIFEAPALVLCWLGCEGIDDCDAAFDLMDRWIELGSKTHKPGHFGLDDVPLQDILGPPTEHNLKAYASLQQLMSLDYWQRTWVLQEASAADTTVVYYSKCREYPLDKIFHARNAVMSFVARGAPPEYGLMATPSTSVGRIENFEGTRREADSARDFLELLQVIRRTGCSDVRDKVYSMLPFANDVGDDYMQDEFLRPNYQVNASEAYTNVVRSHISRHRNLRFLGYCASLGPEPESLGLPSWVPDWTQVSYLHPLHQFNGTDSLRFAACGPYSHTSDMAIPESSTNLLRQVGLFIATVSRVLPPVVDSFLGMSVEVEWMMSVQSRDAYPLNGETVQTAFETTIVADRLCTGWDVENKKKRHKKRFKRGGRVIWPLEEQDAGVAMINTRTIKMASHARRLFFCDSRVKQEKLTESGSLLGLGRDDVEVGDEIWALQGGEVLYCLRKAVEKEQPVDSGPEVGDGRDQNTYNFVGEAYVHGLMDGEALQYSKMSREQRPEVLRGMEGDFREIYLQ